MSINIMVNNTHNLSMDNKKTASPKIIDTSPAGAFGKKPAPKANPAWPNSINVYTSSSQYDITVTDVYFNKIANQLKQSTNKSLTTILNSLSGKVMVEGTVTGNDSNQPTGFTEKNSIEEKIINTPIIKGIFKLGKIVKNQFKQISQASSKNPKADLFNSTTDKSRRAVFISNDQFKSNSSNFQQALNNKFSRNKLADVPIFGGFTGEKRQHDLTIKNLVNPSKSQLKAAIDWAGQGGGNAESLISFDCHGITVEHVKAEKSGKTYLQATTELEKSGTPGSFSGVLEINDDKNATPSEKYLGETELKQMVKSANLKNSIITINACYSGAFTAKKPTTVQPA